MENLTPEAIQVLQEFCALEFTQSCDNVLHYSNEQKVTAQNGETITVAADPQQVEIWLQRKAMFSGLCKALKEYQELKGIVHDFVSKFPTE